jgi:hypothetical protein
MILYGSQNIKIVECIQFIYAFSFSCSFKMSFYKCKGMYIIGGYFTGHEELHPQGHCVRN